jgi:hypothetical protein
MILLTTTIVALQVTRLAQLQLVQGTQGIGNEQKTTAFDLFESLLIEG